METLFNNVEAHHNISNILLLNIGKILFHFADARNPPPPREGQEGIVVAIKREEGRKRTAASC